MYQSDSGEFATIRASTADIISNIPEKDSALINSITGDKGLVEEDVFAMIFNLIE
jgi:hypothetical protein